MWQKLESDFWGDLEKKACNEEYKTEYKAFRLGSQFKGLTKNQKRDYFYYLENGRKEKCYQNFFAAKSNLTYKPKSVEEWFWLWDTHGFGDEKELDSPDIKDSEAIKQIKEFTNLSIKMWTEDCVSMLFQPREIIERLLKEENLPSWVIKAFIEQCKRELIKKNEFLLSFQRVQLDLANYKDGKLVDNWPELCKD